MHQLTWDPIHLLRPDAPAPASYQPLTEFPLVIVVGLTGVGKTTTLRHLADLPASLLPNRREVTDRAVITPLQHAAGQPPRPVTDRLQRFEYTARYRAEYFGGLAHALTRLSLDPAAITPPLLFDGLRGLAEVQGAVRYFPRPYFIVLDAPNIVRIRRLLNRGDAFDTAPTARVEQSLSQALAAIPHIDTVLSATDRRALIRSVPACPPAELVQKTSIVVKESRNYDATTALAYLRQTLTPAQLFIRNTAEHVPAAIAADLKQWLREIS